MARHHRQELFMIQNETIKLVYSYTKLPISYFSYWNHKHQAKLRSTNSSEAVDITRMTLEVLAIRTDISYGDNLLPTIFLHKPSSENYRSWIWSIFISSNSVAHKIKPELVTNIGQQRYPEKEFYESIQKKRNYMTFLVSASACPNWVDIGTTCFTCRQWIHLLGILSPVWRTR